MSKGVRVVLAILGLAASGAAQAHTGLHADGSFLAGVAHPFVGLDHLLAMVAVGAWAAQIGGRRMLALPGTFVAAMVAGAVLGAAGLAMPLVDAAIALSVVALGAILAFRPRSAWYWAVPLVGALGLVHGQAHGAEMPVVAAPWLYFAGFTAATAVLHALGVGGGTLLRSHSVLLRAGGAAVGLAGLWLIAAI